MLVHISRVYGFLAANNVLIVYYRVKMFVLLDILNKI